MGRARPPHAIDPSLISTSGELALPGVKAPASGSPAHFRTDDCRSPAEQAGRAIAELAELAIAILRRRRTRTEEKSLVRVTSPAHPRAEDDSGMLSLVPTRIRVSDLMTDAVAEHDAPVSGRLIDRHTGEMRELTEFERSVSHMRAQIAALEQVIVLLADEIDRRNAEPSQ